LKKILLEGLTFGQDFDRILSILKKDRILQEEL
jgi:hypothetical protein